jgi:hypothetical protein
MHGPKEIKCTAELSKDILCGRLFHMKWEFQWHEIDCHKPAECPKCHVKFKTDTNVKQHLKNLNKKT